MALTRTCGWTKLFPNLRNTSTLHFCRIKRLFARSGLRDFSHLRDRDREDLHLCGIGRLRTLSGSRLIASSTGSIRRNLHFQRKIRQSAWCISPSFLQEHCTSSEKSWVLLKFWRVELPRRSWLSYSFMLTRRFPQRETAQAINGWKLQRAVKFLENVQEHKEAVPMRRYAGGTGRAAQGMRTPLFFSKENTILIVL